MSWRATSVSSDPGRSVTSPATPVADAFYRAGRAVAGARLGFTPPGWDLTRRARDLGQPQAFTGWDVRRYLITHYAGHYACVLAGDPRASAREDASGDLGCGDEVWMRCQEEAFAFVRESQNWRAIEAVAAELLLHGRLDGDEIAIIVEVADGTSPLEELAGYRSGRERG